MRILPKPMREPVSLGYLLARASDTLADTESLPAELRLDMLNRMAELVQGGTDEDWYQRLSKEVMPLQQHRGENVLLSHMQAVMSWLHGMESDSVKQAVLTVMGHILRGQRLDIERFELQAGFRFSGGEELEEYCYMVAGCVGEFWTQIGCHTLDSFSTADSGQLMEWGRNYGKGLQLINILRDLPNDLNVGRCYLPKVNPEDTEDLLHASQQWRERARAYLQDGQAYAQSLTGRRTRMATALPGLIGLRTLDLMEVANWETLSHGVKVQRSEVYRCAWDAFIL
ncbi:squalene/phytoene synthase family protein [Verrucomicrobiaceae bacterium N1E253]|uniref:Squalene/phytoene synthase family protein n=2 Tax=Oceaniferula marina TaxID=2748318 RepID=A0A851GGL2_9BACT|nr:squalene/phytoene synthase family protein [Oceaniferula marina]